MISGRLWSIIGNFENNYLPILIERCHDCYEPMFKNIESDRCLMCKKILEGTCTDEYFSLTKSEHDLLTQISRDLGIKDLESLKDENDTIEEELSDRYYSELDAFCKKHHLYSTYYDDDDGDHKFDYILEDINYKNIDFKNNPPFDYYGEIITKKRIKKAREVKSAHCVDYLKKEAGILPFWTVTNYRSDNYKYPVYYLFDRSKELKYWLDRYVHMINVVRGVEERWY